MANSLITDNLVMRIGHLILGVERVAIDYDVLNDAAIFQISKGGEDFQKSISHGAIGETHWRLMGMENFINFMKSMGWEFYSRTMERALDDRI